MTDDKLLEEFFQPMRDAVLPDDGFSQSVMSRVPQCNTLLLSRLWTVFCVAVAVVLFWQMDGLWLVARQLMLLVCTPPSTHNLLMLALSVGVVGFLAVSDLVHRELAEVWRGR